MRALATVPVDRHLFTNGVNITGDSLDGATFKSVVESQKRRAQFIADYKGASTTLQALPFVWCHKSPGRRHHVSDLFLCCNIVAAELGYASASAYVLSRGWKVKVSKDKRTVEYRHISEVVDAWAPNGDAAKNAKNLHAMVDTLYEVLEEEVMQDIFGNCPAVDFLKKVSLLAKIRSHSQDFHFGYIVVNDYLIDHVPEKKGDVEFWMKVVFRTCRTRKQYILCCNNFNSIFPNGGDPVLAKELLENFRECMRDEVARRAAAIEHHEAYSRSIDEHSPSPEEKHQKHGNAGGRHDECLCSRPMS